MNYKLMKFFFLRGGIFRRFATKRICKKEGGEYYSQTLRRLYKDIYDMDVGIMTYGCFTNAIRKKKGYPLIIGPYCSFAGGVDRLIGNHPYRIASTHPYFHLKSFGAVEVNNYDCRCLAIGADVWVGVKATITGSVQRIGVGAIIGAGAVVTHDVEPYAIVAGVPAKVIGYRFPKEERSLLLDSEWWELSPAELKPIIPFAEDVKKFCDAVAQIKASK